MPRLVRIKDGYVVLYPERLFDESAVVDRWFTEQSILLGTSLRRWAPERTGRLKRSIRVDESRTGLEQRTIAVRFGVKYAGYTDKGTKGPITAGGKRMPVGKSQGVAGLSRYEGRRAGKYRSRADYTYKTSVRGQARTNWVQDAISSVPAFKRYRD